MAEYAYFGTYARFDTVSKKDAAALLGADNLVGDVFSIECETQDGETRAWMVNRFGAKIGFFDAATSRKLSICAARGWAVHALLAFVAFTDAPDPGHYWGEAALVCYDTAHAEAFEAFMTGVGQRLGDGIRPDVDLGEQGVSQVIGSAGSWTPSKTIPMPEKERGTVIMKSRRKLSEKMIEQGRKGNKGCYAVSWIFLLAVVAGILFGLKSCGVF